MSLCFINRNKALSLSSMDVVKNNLKTDRAHTRDTAIVIISTGLPPVTSAGNDHSLTTKMGISRRNF
jgi:hypothetical protein